MQKRHFEALALQLKYERPPSQSAAKSYQWEKDVKAVARACFNSKFNKDRFIEACGGLFNA